MKLKMAVSSKRDACMSFQHSTAMKNVHVANVAIFY